MKKKIHPEWFQKVNVYCDSQLIMTTESTKQKLNVDIWSKNHPFYTGSQRLIDAEGRIERFLKKYILKESEFI